MATSPLNMCTFIVIFIMLAISVLIQVFDVKVTNTNVTVYV